MWGNIFLFYTNKYNGHRTVSGYVDVSYVFKVTHIQMIIGCDLFKNLREQMDFDYQHVVINKQCVRPETIALLGVVITSSTVESEIES